MSNKNDRSIRSGFALGGAAECTFEKVGNNYRRASLVLASGDTATIFKIPSTSHLDGAALKRKARDMVRRLERYDTAALTW